ncbi:hypothetical protein BT63DRAFT_192493 [Microthyrium microscopicum]|uniref:Uncharacterized protein n=1 Tax=Microthyrium microscopicum TaxID=703497 RepID=A0A6A6UL80_9PEZI|nr:hypothetical protein BT63DRAFT_192493 [Microthyrium microscopicum]
MEYRRYTAEQLHHLKGSPLVKKPDNLPSIEEWMEGSTNGRQQSQDQNGRRKLPPPKDENGQENALSRLAGGLRRPKPAVEDNIILGPPKMGFTSNNRRAEPTEKRTSLGLATEDTAAKDGDFREGFFRARNTDALPIREKQNGLGVNRRPRESGDDATNGRPRRNGREDGNRWDQLERDRNRRDRDADPTETPLRRNGVGRGRFDSNWIRPENGEGESNRAENKAPLWRDRERDRDRDHDKGRRDWTRGNKYDGHAEEEPEWMNDEPVNQEEKQAKTQDDFQRWKEQQKQMQANKIASTEKEETPEPVVAKAPALMTTKSTSVLPTLGNMFGAFEEIGKKDKEVESTARPAMSKKPSRFEGLFKREEPAMQPLPSLGEMASRPPANDNVSPSNEDQQGFQRILAMLGNNTTPKPADGARPPPAQPMSPSEHERQGDRPQLERQRDSASFVEDLLARQSAAKDRNAIQQNQGMHMQRDMEQFALRQGQIDMGRLPNERETNPPRHEGFPRGHHENGHAQPQTQSLDPNRAFLLNLMNNQRPSESAGMDYAQFAGQKNHGMPQQAQHLNQRNTPSAPPGLDPRRLAEQDMHSTRRAPPGFFDHDAGVPENNMAPPGLQRRNTSEAGNPTAQMSRPGQSQASNLGIPSLRMNDMMIMRNGGHMGADGRVIQGPPPGLMPSNGGPQSQAPGIMDPRMNGPGGPIPNGGMRPNGPPMGPPGFPPQGMPINMHGMPQGPPPGGAGHFPMGPPHPNHFFGGPPGMPQMGGPGQQGFFPPGGRGFPPQFEGHDMRGPLPQHGRGFQGQ